MRREVVLAILAPLLAVALLLLWVRPDVSPAPADRAAQPTPTAGAGWRILLADGAGRFAYPTGIAIDGAGNLYLADTGNDRIQKLSPNGEPLALWGARGPEPGHFRSPHGLAIDGAGNVYVADTKNHRVQKLSPAGQPLAQWGA